MISNLEKYKLDLSKLINSGEDLISFLGDDNSKLSKFRSGYEIWYSEAVYLVKNLLNERTKDFELYYNNPKSNCIKNALVFTPPKREALEIDTLYLTVPASISDRTKVLFINQLNILKSIEQRFESSLFDIKQLVQGDLFDSELGAAKELNKNKFSRAAGALAGVVLEKHLTQVCDNHNIKITKKDPSISDLNDLLKNNSVIETKDWRFIQHLGDIRNLCDHKKTKEPTHDDVQDLINGVEKITKTIF